VIDVRVGDSIAGRVAQTGQAMNIADAYDEPLFNAAPDQHTGYRTRQML
jgi:adenylate cyclase